MDASESKLIEFIRVRDYEMIKELGQGACGKTVLLKDDIVDEYFVCKKYYPYDESVRQELFKNFVREIKLLHKIYHPNVVRVFNHYLYPEHYTGYILMEYVDGSDIEDYLKNAPEKTNEIFLQTIEGFRYLETNNILHRDIRPFNIMVSNSDHVKIIDLGFGKRIERSKDFDKSISLNLWCDPPNEFKNSVYDFTTEVYFVGKLFEKIIHENNIDHFEYLSLLNGMCKKDHSQRIDSFFEVDKEINSNKFFEIDFDEDELSKYRKFAVSINQHITKIEVGSKYNSDFDQIQKQLEISYRNIMLEETAPDSGPILRNFINGQYYYKKTGFPVSALQDFIHLMKSSSQEKIRIIMANLQTRLDSIPRYDDVQDYDDIPF